MTYSFKRSKFWCNSSSKQLWNSRILKTTEKSSRLKKSNSNSTTKQIKGRALWIWQTKVKARALCFSLSIIKKQKSRDSKYLRNFQGMKIRSLRRIISELHLTRTKAVVLWTNPHQAGSGRSKGSFPVKGNPMTPEIHCQEFANQEANHQKLSNWKIKLTIWLQLDLDILF